MKEHNWKESYAHLHMFGYDKSVTCDQCGAVAIRRRTGDWKLHDAGTERDCDQEVVMWPIRKAHEL